MYLLNGDSSDEVEQTTFSELDKKERDIEELLRKNINMVCEGEESMLINICRSRFWPPQQHEMVIFVG